MYDALLLTQNIFVYDTLLFEQPWSSRCTCVASLLQVDLGVLLRQDDIRAAIALLLGAVSLLWAIYVPKKFQAMDILKYLFFFLNKYCGFINIQFTSEFFISQVNQIRSIQKKFNLQISFFV